MEYELGGLYSVRGETDYQIMKVLATDDIGVHVSLYRNRFAERPASIDVRDLSLSFSIEELQNDSADFTLGSLHMPISYGTIEEWEPVYLFTTEVDERELRAVQEWKDSGGGYW